MNKPRGSADCTGDGERSGGAEVTRRETEVFVSGRDRSRSERRERGRDEKLLMGHDVHGDTKTREELKDYRPPQPRNIRRLKPQRARLGSPLSRANGLRGCRRFFPPCAQRRLLPSTFPFNRISVMEKNDTR